jgi:3-deoxy-7-phosphoheptulonate synthase
MDEMTQKMIIVGPCSLESRMQLEMVMNVAQDLDLTYIRAQVFKPRTNPTSFQGLGLEGIAILKEFKNSPEYSHFKFVCEVCSIEHFNMVKDVASIIQIGARNMQNFELLKYIGQHFDEAKHDYILLKRGFANNLQEWIASAHYLIAGKVKKEQIILCERGSRSYTSPTGVSLDFIAALSAQGEGFHVIIDPSHGSKDRRFVLPLAKAALAMNFDGVMLEVHPKPDESVSDKEQAISLEALKLFFDDT